MGLTLDMGALPLEGLHRGIKLSQELGAVTLCHIGQLPAFALGRVGLRAHRSKLGHEARALATCLIG